MADTIPNSFKVEFDEQVKLVYQDTGQKFKKVVRNVKTAGSTYTFQMLGTGQASAKARGAQIPRMNLGHTAPTATLVKRYASEAIDDLDKYVQSYDETAKLAQICTMAVGRAEDLLIKTEIYRSSVASGNVIAHSNKGWTKVKAQMLHRAFGEAHIFESGVGNNVVFVSSAGFEALLDIDGFSNADYMGVDELPFKMSGLQGKKWLGFEWYTYDSLKKVGDVCYNIAFNSECIGYASAVDITSKVYFNDDTDENVAMAKMFGGCTEIDPDGIVVIETNEPALTE